MDVTDFSNNFLTVNTVVHLAHGLVSLNNLEATTIEWSNGLLLFPLVTKALSLNVDTFVSPVLST